MKATVNYVLPILLVAVTTMGLAQPVASSPFWVVEGNIRKADYTIIRFYDAQHQLMKEEIVSGAFLDIRKKHNQRLLESKLKNLFDAQFQATTSRRKVKSKG